MSDDRVLLGVIVGPRGIKGELRIKSFTEVPEDVAAYGPLTDKAGRQTYPLQVTGVAKGVVVGRLPGVADRNQAEALKGTELYVERAALPAPEEDEYYVSDLLGLDAVTIAGEALGRIRTVDDYGAGPVLEIAGGGFGTVMVPFTRACVPEVRVAERTVVVDPPEGLLEPPGDEREDGSEGHGE
jgi:16S rRNA processing protein RimM